MFTSSTKYPLLALNHCFVARRAFQKLLCTAELGALGALDVSDPIVAALSKLATDKPKSVLSVGATCYIALHTAFITSLK